MNKQQHPAPLSSPSGSTLSSGYSFDISRWKPTLLSSDSSMVDVICWLPVVDEGSALSLLHTDFSLPSNVGSKQGPYLAELKSQQSCTEPPERLGVKYYEPMKFRSLQPLVKSMVEGFWYLDIIWMFKYLWMITIFEKSL